MLYTLEWDPRKGWSNALKHGVGVEEAATVFKDPKMLTLFDTEHSESEERWITLGISERGRLLVVSHIFRDVSADAVVIRIFSCRKATLKENLQYQE